jgi:hypothetical protein
VVGLSVGNREIRVHLLWLCGDSVPRLMCRIVHFRIKYPIPCRLNVKVNAITALAKLEISCEAYARELLRAVANPTAE